MPRDLRMSRMLHVLIHLDRHVPRATSEQIAVMVSTNAVVVRRMMAGLRERGVVTSEKGHGGGWQLARSLADITLRDVYYAVGRPPLFNVGTGAEPADCLVETAVDAQLDSALRDAEAHLLARFAEISVESLAQDFERRFAALRNAPMRADDAPCTGPGTKT
ncbi:RrF2 family transcriptional regulator [Roseivivax isoporae]|uniref:Rrf2 family transcriptional regulator n=1 Tax=Roseivivax isoporae LMG 25204 TaxID=1449351 RepID=X7F7F9_9RHOB|nr:Rrf2 family transcriptional regulator [Roseivivax isoporae]ETX28653.1 Rrf2 family transcriptional regulator [Roseivivax isoporae LMG 25204]